MMHISGANVVGFCVMRRTATDTQFLQPGEPETISCRSCEIEKPSTDFYLTTYISKKTGLRSRQTLCILCYTQRSKDYLNAPGKRKLQSERTLAWKQNQLKIDPEGYKQRRRAAYLWNNYRLTVDLWDQMIITQSGRCWTCEEPLLIPCIDHDHASNEVCGLLCPDCNRGLGAFRDSPATLLRAIEYLTSPRPKREGVAVLEVMSNHGND